MEQKRTGFFFYRAIFDSVSQLKKREKTTIYEAIFAYALNMEEPNMEGWSDTAKAIWALAKPMLDNDLRRFENGCKGGAPKGAHNNPNGRGTRTNRELTENKPTNNKNRIQEQEQEQSVCEECAPAHAPTQEEAHLKKLFSDFDTWCSAHAPLSQNFPEPLTFEQFAWLYKNYGNKRMMQCAVDIHDKEAYKTHRNAMNVWKKWIPKVSLAC
jgi:hypothetical protein